MYGINIAQGPVVPWLVIGTNVSVSFIIFSNIYCHKNFGWPFHKYGFALFIHVIVQVHTICVILGTI